MPTYDYVCDACGHRFDLFQSMLDKPIKKCPKCSRLKVRRLIGTGGGIIFKGSGFYQTDYRTESYKSAAKADAESGSAKGGDGKAGDTKGTDAKAPKSEPKEAVKPKAAGKQEGGKTKSPSKGKT